MGTDERAASGDAGILGVPDYLFESTGGGMIRAACWLATCVGEGGVFTKEELRAAIPGHSQIDRRVRDLRTKFDWVIEESRVGKGLDQEQQRLVKIGVHVWDKEARKSARKDVTIPPKIRDEVLRRDGHACIRCGISAGEAYDDDPTKTARLTAAHIYPDALGGRATAADLVTECQRCNEEVQQETGNHLDGPQVWVRVTSLGRTDRTRLLDWMNRDRRPIEKVEEVWRAYRQLPGVERENVKANLIDLLRD